MTFEIPLSSIDFSSYNSRLGYSPDTIEDMANSMAVNGQIVSVKVRFHAYKKGRYELIFGHRRFLAAKKLGWKAIRADLVNTTDEEVLCQSLIENFERKSISDYEKAIAFETLKNKFNESYEDIGKKLGISRQHVCSYVAMLRLFDKGQLESNPTLGFALLQIDEHHSRLLSRVSDHETRANLLLMVAREKISVRHLANIISRLRSWFPGSGEISPKSEEPSNSDYSEMDNAIEVEEITRLVLDEFKMAQRGDYEGFKRLHLIGLGYSYFPSYPPLNRFENANALIRESDWFYKIMTAYLWKIEDLQVVALGRTALATLIVRYSCRAKPKIQRVVRGTMVFAKHHNTWGVLHEHWSQLRPAPLIFPQLK